MPLATIEIAHNLIGITVSEEFKIAGTKIIEKICKNDANLINSKITINVKQTIRLGSYPCSLIASTIAANAYKSLEINEQHHHRYKL